MASNIRAVSYALVAAFGISLAGCANDGGGMFGATTTASIPEKPKVDPACVQLAAQIDTLKKDGAVEKLEKAAASKKHKMTQADLSKVAQLNKANSEFQARCTTMTTAQLAPAAGQAPSNSPAQTATSASQPAVAGP